MGWEPRWSWACFSGPVSDAPIQPLRLLLTATPASERKSRWGVTAVGRDPSGPERPCSSPLPSSNRGTSMNTRGFRALPPSYHVSLQPDSLHPASPGHPPSHPVVQRTESSIPRDFPKDTTDQARPAYVHSGPPVAPGVGGACWMDAWGPYIRVQGPP